MTTTLTLPIRIGKRYVRRDGNTVTARKPLPDFLDLVAFVGENEQDGYQGHVWVSTGRVYAGASGDEHPFDLVADAEPETPAQPTGHLHAALMAQYAEDAKATAEPWKLWEKRSESEPAWSGLQYHPVWRIDSEYRRRARTIRVGDIDVPEPMREAPPIDTPVFSVDILSGHARFTWTGSKINHEWMAAGFLHLSREAAEAHAEAILELYRKARQLPQANNQEDK